MTSLILGPTLEHPSVVILEDIDIKRARLGVHFEYRNSVLVMHNAATIKVPLNIDWQIARGRDALHTDRLPRISGSIPETEWLQLWRD